MKTTHAVTVLGREISVRSSATAEKVMVVEKFVNDRLHTIGSALSSGDAQLVLTLALLNTAEELLESRKNQELYATLDSRIQAIISKLDTP